MRSFTMPLQAITLVLELAGLLVLAGRRVTCVVLSGFILLRVAILTSSGIFFWKWVLLDAVLISYLIVMDKSIVREVFPKRHLVLSILLIVMNTFMQSWNAGSFDTVSLGWFDGRVNQYYQFLVLGTSGERYGVSKNFFSPYDIAFAQNRVYFLNDRVFVADTYGTMFDYDLYRTIEVEGREGVLRTLKEGERGGYAPGRADRFDSFISTVFSNLNRRGRKTIFWNRFSAPLHIQSTTTENPYKLQEPVEAVEVNYVETYYDGETIELVEKRMVRRIATPVE